MSSRAFAWRRSHAFGCLIALVLPTPALADAEIDAPGEPIIVTARLREERVQDVPAALAVVSGETLAHSHTVNISQLTQLVPSLNYSSPNPRNTAFTIRGLGSSVVSISQANDGLEPGVGFYVDGVYHARPASAAFDFMDIERIEVLRGPQGTLYGKNTTAGAINLTTRKPEFTFGAEAEASYGQQGFVQAKAALTGPLLGDLAAFRLSGSLTRRDGVIWNTALNKWQNAVHNDALRGEVLLTPASDLTLRLIGDWSDFKAECCTQVYVRVAPTLKPVAQQYAALAAKIGYVPPSTNPYDRLTSIDAAVGTNTSEGGATAIGEWRTGPSTVTSITAWRFWDWDAANDRDYTGLPIQMTQHIPSRQTQFSQELRLAQNLWGGRFEWVEGLYYFHQRIVGHPISIYGPLATYWLLPASATRTAALLNGYGSSGTTDFRTDSYAAFGEATLHLTPRLALTGGIRYTYEEKYGSYAVQTSGGQTVAAGSALFNDQQSILRAQSYTANLGEGGASGRANLAWKVTPDAMLYVSYARGQKAGGINMSGLPVYPAGVAGHASGDPILSTAVVRPERNTTWEAGLKTTALGDKLTFNVDGYITVVRDFQANVVDNAAVIALRSYLANIPRVTVKGIEAEAELRASSHLTLRASGSYAHGRYADYPAGPCPIELTGSATTQCNLTGKPLPGLPAWSGTFTGEYTAPIGHGEAYLRADVSARTKVYGDATDSAYTVIPGYTVVNASIGYRLGAHWDISVFARNLFDANYLQNVTVQAGNSGLIVGTPSDPRMFGMTLRVKS